VLYRKKATLVAIQHEGQESHHCLDQKRGRVAHVNLLSGSYEAGMEQEPLQSAEDGVAELGDPRLADRLLKTAVADQLPSGAHPPSLHVACFRKTKITSWRVRFPDAHPPDDQEPLK
jgi:hypothetical protein